MTNRRSMKVDVARSSRAFQFIPGHVGGRVDSAQPVRRRATVGAFAREPGGPPSMVYSYRKGALNSETAGMSGSLPDPPEGLSMAAMLIGASGYSGLTIPSGWVELARGKVGTPNDWGGRIDEYAVCVLDDPANCGLSYSFSTRVPWSGTQLPKWEGVAYSLSYFTGGSGGYWLPVHGEDRVSSSYSPITQPPPGCSAFVQFGLITGIYNYNGITPPVGIDRPLNASVIGGYIGPQSGGLDGVTPASGIVDWNQMNAYGWPNSTSWALGWFE